MASYWKDGSRQSQAEVARWLGVTRNVVSRLWKEFQTTANVARTPEQGRPRVTTLNQDRYLSLLVRRNRRMTASQLRSDLNAATGVLVSTDTIRRRLHKKGLYARRPIICVPLTPPQKRARKLWCRQHVALNPDEWRRVMFTDESRFSLNSDSRRVFVWGEVGTRNNTRNMVERDPYISKGFMVWAGIFLGGRTALHILRQGTLTGQRYRDEILAAYVMPQALEMGENFLLMDDNARPHRAGVVDTFLQNHPIARMNWPARSPDLNPIEHVWDNLGRRISSLQPPPRNTHELETALTQEMPGHRKRRQFKQTDAFTRGMVIGLKRAGWSIRQIAADTHLGASTVHRLWRRWLEQGNVAIYKNVGATRVTSARVDRRILRQAVAAPQATCTAILQHVQDTLDHSISTRTISRRLVANGLHSCRPLRRLPLTPPNRRQRLEWCRARSTWMTEWHRVVFSDESRFCLSSDSRRVRVWRRRGERSNPAAIVERPTVRQRGIMGVPNALYQQDNARPHTARISQQALQDVQMLPWPPYSPDLSPIEHVWDIIGRRLHALPQPRSEDELWQMVEREWRAIPQDAIRTLIDSLPRRVAANHQKKRRFCRKRKTATSEDRYLVVTAKRHREMTAIQLSNELSSATGTRISRQTAYRRLQEGALYARRPMVCIPLTSAHRRARLNWCLEHHAWTHDQWANVLFSDESRFSLNTDSRRVFICREPGTRYHPKIKLVHNLIFMDDNARPHRARLVNEYLQSENIRRMDWPARSPDLNPIEHAWDALGRRIGARHPSPRTLVKLGTALLEEWGLLPLDLQSL
ncbi:hypothetical protein LAZ67_2005841, partial [Cordylochernes scorpioides]